MNQVAESRSRVGIITEMVSIAICDCSSDFFLYLLRLVSEEYPGSMVLITFGHFFVGIYQGHDFGIFRLDILNFGEKF